MPTLPIRVEVLVTLKAPSMVDEAYAIKPLCKYASPATSNAPAMYPLLYRSFARRWSGVDEPTVRSASVVVVPIPTLPFASIVSLSTPAVRR
jgi:hypothetical protein